MTGQSQQTGVQNGTSDQADRVNDLVEKFRGFTKQAAASIIEMAKVLVQAKVVLSSENFAYFCEKVGVDPDGTTCRKLKIIGDHASRFDAVIDKLPNNWTTIYGLARLPANEFDLLAKDDVITPFMKASELPNHRSSKKSGAASQTFTLSMPSFDESTVRELIQELRRLEERFGLQLRGKALGSQQGPTEEPDVAA